MAFFETSLMLSSNFKKQLLLFAPAQRKRLLMHENPIKYKKGNHTEKL